MPAGVLDLLWADYLDAAHVSPAPSFDLWKAETGPGLDREGFDRSLGSGVDASLDQAEALAKMQSGMRAQLARAKLTCLPDRHDPRVADAGVGAHRDRRPGRALNPEAEVFAACRAAKAFAMELERID